MEEGRKRGEGWGNYFSITLQFMFVLGHSQLVKIFEQTIPSNELQWRSK